MLDKEANILHNLIGEDEEKTVRQIANEELAAQLLSGEAEASFETLQDLAAWLEDHPEDVAAINAAIALNAENIAKEENRAKGAENSLRSALNEEVQLREAQINGLNFSTKEEVNRAKKAEKLLDDRIAAENSRALLAEQNIRDSFNEYENTIGFVKTGEKSLVEVFNELLETEAGTREDNDQ
jgi:hypothetical protein